MIARALLVGLLLAVPRIAVAEEDIERELDVLELDLRAESRLTWQAVSPLLAAGGAVVQDAVSAFVAEFDGAQVCYQEHCRDVRTPEAATARAWLDAQAPASAATPAPPVVPAPEAPAPADPPAVVAAPQEPRELRRDHVGLAIEAARGTLVGPEISWHRHRVYAQLRIGLGAQPSEDLFDDLAAIGPGTKTAAEQMRSDPWMNAQLQTRLAVELAPDIFRLGVEARVWDEELFGWETVGDAGLVQWNSRGVAAGPYLAAGFLAGPVMVRFCSSYHFGLHNFRSIEETRSFGEAEDGRLTRWDVMDHRLNTWVDATVVIGPAYAGIELGPRLILANPYARDELGQQPVELDTVFSLRAGFAY